MIARTAWAASWAWSWTLPPSQQLRVWVGHDEADLSEGVRDRGRGQVAEVEVTQEGWGW